jgi:hypothetical protein
MKYIPTSERAKQLFEINNRLIKPGLILERSIWFINSDCDWSDDNTYWNTFKYGFWLDKNEVEEIKLELFEKDE